jgi:GT2 family glycosyltransferase
LGNTAGLMMMNKNTFSLLNGFNENYTQCFEDVELNLKLLTKGFDNYLLGSHPAYHYESKTRDLEATQYEVFKDFNEHFVPFVERNLKSLKDKIFFKH